MTLNTKFFVLGFTATVCLLFSATTTNAMRRRGHQPKPEGPVLIVVDKIEDLSNLQANSDKHSRFFSYHNDSVFYIKIENDDIICLENFKALIKFMTPKPGIAQKPGITHLDASRTCITDEQLSAILELCGDTLIELKLDSCFNVQTPVMKCPKLIKLSMSKCFQITDRCLAAILKQCESTLQELDLSYCIGLVDPKIDCPELKILNLTYCANLVKPTIICPKLVLISRP